MASLLLTLVLLANGQAVERIASFQIHGNTVTPESEVLEAAGLHLGAEVGPRTFDDAAERLRASKKFEHVEVLKRYASIADLSQVLCVIVVDEGPIKVDWDKNHVEPDGTVVFAPVRKAGGTRPMFLPLLDFEDGYGFAYGVRAAIPNPVGAKSLLSFPATWGGQKRAGIEFEKELATLVTRVKAGADIVRREHPFFDENDDRKRFWVRGERDVGRSLRLGIVGGQDRVSFRDERDRVTRLGADVVLDTRLDPMLARNAVYARAAWDRLAFDGADSARRTELESRGYLGLLGQSVLVVRAMRQDSDRALPDYLKPIFGGASTVRGLKAGTAVGDTVAVGSAELRLPLTSPLSVGKLGASAFVDVGTAYAKGAKIRDQRFSRGVGGGVWFSAAVVRLNVYVAHALGGSTRAHFGTTVLF